MNRVVVIFSCLFVLGGCMYRDEPMPQIVEIYGSAAPELVEPKVTKPARPAGNINYNVPEEWLAPAGLEKRWTAIVIHHSGTENGNIAIFDRFHREDKLWDGIGYDFVIGNGTDSGDGEVEVTFRWREQLTGAHCKTPGNWANEDAVGICLVGNFNKTEPTARQMRSLLKLVRFLQKRYRIDHSRVYGHNTTPGARTTECPGRRFPMSRLKSMLGS